ncbi:uncharacterized protein Z520_08607 [Fonsecaea multimorphosa CBS 102226]|uniref:Cytochrome b561 domain-containing protein n=1 Tax=Fonsecaea multimorphosa CBS 102226 TaxID=1442371 RepID=A0A0D2JQ65_9EURO|nr:uncharacterized protein Z520_08607 [Fonsecaea multimorphosa CBS 102226]KIX95487.1 hypothetical protein Z520_08607 [Fonsecaea multimorphosa CBS 102226]OAL21333.1 hypothetical protein AYO22_08056 [Fonsecaea multimorphosa]
MSGPEVVATKESSLLPRAVPAATKHRSDKVHGIIMGTTVIIIFPFASISWRLLDRLVSGRTLFRIHVCCQLLGLAMLITGFGLGVWVCIIHDEVYNDAWGHTFLGTILTALFILQPMIGQWHHYLYISRTRQTKPWIRVFHIWMGRLLMVAAIINGATGIVLAANTPGGEKGYSSAAGIVGVFYIVILLLWYWNRSKQNLEKDSQDMTMEGNADVEGKTLPSVGVSQI